MDPDDPEAWYQRARCQERLGRLDEARRDLAKARELGWSEERERER
jgi:Flp pilus assembly protein TadD